MSSFLSKLFGEKKIYVFSQSFYFEHQINSLNTEISTHYWIVYLYSKNICFDVFILRSRGRRTVRSRGVQRTTIDKCFNFFRNMFYSKRIKTNDIIIIHIQSNPMSFKIRILIKIFYICPILYFNETAFW